MRSLIWSAIILCCGVFAIADENGKVGQDAEVNRAAVVNVTAGDLEPLTLEAGWKNVPAFLRGARLHSQALERRGADLAIKVDQPGLVVLLAEWLKTPDLDRDWAQWKTVLPELKSQGWTTIAEIHRTAPDSERPQVFLVFRRVARTGESLSFPGESLAKPRLVVLDDKLAGAAAACNPAVITSNDLAHIRYPRRLPGVEITSQDQTVLVESFPPAPDVRASQGILQRELFRQALLIAAREELGLHTRDRSLHDVFPTAEQPGPSAFGVVFNRALAGALGVTVFRERDQAPEVLWGGEPTCDADPSLEDMVQIAERLSRHDFVDVLKKAGFQPRRRPVQMPAGESVLESIESRLSDFNWLVQFDTARRLHQELIQAPESPSLLSALARAYTNFGTTTLSARALLYAERLVALRPESPESYWTRAWVRAFVGLHRTALQDLQRADELCQGQAPAGASTPPAWSAAIDACCRFDRKRLESLAAHDEIRPIIRQLELQMGIGDSDYARRTRSEIAVFEESPQCWKCISRLASYAGDREIEQAALDQYLFWFPRDLYRRLPNVPGLSEDIARMCLTWRAAHPDDDGQAGRSLDLTEEAGHRVRLLQLLRGSDRPTGPAGEPSLGLLADLIDETGFQQVQCAAFHIRYLRSQPPGPTLERLQPLYADHRFRDYLTATFAADPKVQADARNKLKLSLRRYDAELGLWSNPMFGAAGMHEADPVKELARQREILRMLVPRIDPVYPDLASIQSYIGLPEFGEQETRRLVRCSPYSPLSVTAQIKFDWTFAEPHAAAWEQRFPEELSVLIALSDRYAQLGRVADAERCLTREMQLKPYYGSFFRLSSYYKKWGKLDLWRIALDEYLKQTEELPGLRDRLRTEFADELMTRRRFQEALPYALAAAENHNILGMRCAHRCYDGLEDWERAEEFLRKISDVSSDSSFDWLIWCCRRGRGDSDAARAATSTWIASLGAPVPPDKLLHVAAVHLMNGEKEQALDTYRSAFQKIHDPYAGLFAALIADDLQQPEQRDRFLKEIVDRRVPSAAKKPTNSDLTSLAGLLHRSLANQGESQFDFGGFSELLRQAESQNGIPTTLQYFAGAFLLKHGRRDKALELLGQAATSPVNNFPRVTASVLLHKEKVPIGQQREKE